MKDHSRWKRVSIKDVCASIIDCVNKTAPVVDYPTQYKMIRTTNVKNGWIDIENVKYVTQNIFERWTRRATPKIGDVILTREAPLGEVGMIRTSDKIFLGQRLVQYRANPNYLDNRFLLYAFQEHDLQSQIKALGSGATVEHMRVPDAEKLTLMLPPLPIQRTIAGILSAYDDLIENNTRRITILEEMAQMLYQEWFVKFRFPGHEHVKMVESELGMIPEGWEYVPVSSTLHINPSTSVPRDGEKAFVPMNSLSNNSMLIDNVELRAGNSGSKFKNDDTLFARITPCIENGKTGYVQFLPSSDAVAFGSTEFIVLRSKTLCPEFVYLMARTDAFRDHAIKSMSGATGRQRVQTTCFDTFFIAQPDLTVLTKFHVLVSPIFRYIYMLARKNSNLRRTRDMLLPKLISGEIDVSSWTESEAEEAAQELATTVAGGTSNYTTTAPLHRVAETPAATPIDKDALEWHSLWE